MFLMPSLYEPCGLNQMYSLRYGTIPIVRKTGGLADTVIDVDVNPLAGNGFVFTKPSPLALQNTVIRACKAYNDVEKWQSMQRRGMTQDFSWESSARAYIRLYESAVQARAERDGSSI